MKLMFRSAMFPCLFVDVFVSLFFFSVQRVNVSFVGAAARFEDWALFAPPSRALSRGGLREVRRLLRREGGEARERRVGAQRLVRELRTRGLGHRAAQPGLQRRAQLAAQALAGAGSYPTATPLLPAISISSPPISTSKRSPHTPATVLVAQPLRV